MERFKGFYMKNVFKTLFFLSAIFMLCLMCYHSYVIITEYVEHDSMDILFVVLTSGIITNIFKNLAEV